MDIQQVEKFEQQAAQEKYFHRVAVAFDIFLNVLSGGREDETISSRVRRISDAHPSWKCTPNIALAKIINASLNVFWPDHGQHAQAGDLERAQSTEAVEDKALDLPKE